MFLEEEHVRLILTSNDSKGLTEKLVKCQQA